MQNPYSLPAYHALVRVDSAERRESSIWTILLACMLGSFVALWAGMFACWIRGGWLKLQYQRPPANWDLPIYFWFTTGCIIASAIVVGLLTFPIARYATKQLHAVKCASFAFAICTVATVGYELLKFKDMIEPPTHSLIVLGVAYSIFTPMSFIKRISTTSENPLKKPQGDTPFFWG